MQNACFGDYGWIGSIHDLVHEGREESDEGKVFAIQAYRLCNISDVALVSLSIQ
jgi:hypothetical protein